ncbi:hypothetical protein NIES37_30330 [Tolypothrix tenuis PCC 7101]|uniref:Secreted protein n=1 Tax=Tolypothrix tenuis PCC 7101 TaxID=231146 RepID=A0A1Z4N023_9CYAN|nr:hypothetical protein [Aulosira sp. FACHB-113]BAY99054.1 hypothetical protein NIES37_30330 [Tolypothrix tenuis PCC 7101]BAZ77025.1 hypothetical protein NIES50_56270 [Aulosira laxa NIES-50]
MKVFSHVSQMAALVAILSPMLTINTAHAQQSYPLTCRGGGTLSIQNNGNNGVRINFQAGPGAAPQGLSPGECTWSDRAFRSGEPTTICDSAASASQYVALLVRSDQYPILQVYNNGHGCMKVTRVGP